MIGTAASLWLHGESGLNVGSLPQVIMLLILTSSRECYSRRSATDSMTWPGHQAGTIHTVRLLSVVMCSTTSALPCLALPGPACYSLTASSSVQVEKGLREVTCVAGSGLQPLPEEHSV